MAVNIHASFRMFKMTKRINSKISKSGSTFKLPDCKTAEILRKAGITTVVKVSAAETKSTDTMINAILKEFGKTVRKETKTLNKTAEKQRRANMKSAKEATIKKINAQA